MGFRHMYEKEKYWSITSDFCNFSLFLNQYHRCSYIEEFKLNKKETLHYFVIYLSRGNNG